MARIHRFNQTGKRFSGLPKQLTYTALESRKVLAGFCGTESDAWSIEVIEDSFSYYENGSIASHTLIYTQPEVDPNLQLRSFETYEYDVNGNLLVTDSWFDNENDGQFDSHSRSELTYDQDGNVSSMTWMVDTDNDGNWDETNSDAGGGVDDGSSMTIDNEEFEYDDQGRVIAHRLWFTQFGQSQREFHSYAYDANGNLTSETAEFDYDNDGNWDFRSEVVSQYNEVGGLAQQTTTLFDGASSRSTITFREDGQIAFSSDEFGENGDGTYQFRNDTTYVYDDTGLLIQQVLDRYEGGELISSETLDVNYDDVGTTDGGDGSEDDGSEGGGSEESGDYSYEYVYDDQGRITSSTRSDGLVETWEYDDAGRTVRYTHGDEVQTWEYSQEGWLLRYTSADFVQSWTYDESGRTVSSLEESANKRIETTFQYTDEYTQMDSVESQLDESGNVLSAVRTVTTQYWPTENQAGRQVVEVDRDLDGVFDETYEGEIWLYCGNAAGDFRGDLPELAPTNLASDSDSSLVIDAVFVGLFAPGRTVAIPANTPIASREAPLVETEVEAAVLPENSPPSENQTTLVENRHWSGKRSVDRKQTNLESLIDETGPAS